MITLYTGTPGSGKSLHAAALIWDLLTRKRRVIANYQINTEIIAEKRWSYFVRKIFKSMKPIKNKIGLFFYMPIDRLTPEYLYEFAEKYHKPRKEHQTLLVIDECARKFNCRTWDNKDRMAWLTFFDEHRHYGFDILLMTQKDRSIDRQVRGVIEYNIKHKCVNNFKAFGKIVGLLGGGKMFAAVNYWYQDNEKVGMSMFRLKRKYIHVYDSYHHFGKEDDAAEVGDKGKAGASPAGVPLATAPAALYTVAE